MSVNNYTSITVTNNWAGKAKVKKSKEVKIAGDCLITNYNPKECNGSARGYVTTTIKNGSASIMYGQTGKQQKLDLSKQKYSLFMAVASLEDDDKDTGEDIILSEADIKKINNLESKSKKTELGFDRILKDFPAGAIRFVDSENNTLLRIDFKTENEAGNVSSANSSKPAERPAGARNNTESNQANRSSNDTRAFLEALGGQETRGQKSPYYCMNRAGYVGKYQVGEQAMVEMGIYKKEKDKKYNNDWSGVFVENKYGITSLWDFRISPEKQEEFQIDYKKRDWEHIINKELLEYIGTKINGVKITESGMLAGAHLVGAGGLSRYLKSEGRDDVKDGTGTPVSQYIRQFAGYDVSEITR